MALLQTFARACRNRALLWLLVLLLPAGAMAAPAELVLVDGRGSVALWPAVTVYADPSREMTVEQVLAAPSGFAVPDGKPGNLGRTPDALWLRVPLYLPGVNTARRVLHIDYSSLNHVDAYVVQDGQVRDSGRTGNALPLADRDLASRSQGVTLTLPTGASELYVRVQSHSTMVLPIALRTEADFGAQESASQLLLGSMFGLALCMLLYSVSNWIGLRDSSFIDYALMLGGNVLFFMSYFGIGQLYLWPNWPVIGTWIGPLAVLVSVAAGASFARKALAVREVSVFTDRLLIGVTAAALLSLALACTGMVSYRTMQTFATVLGLLATGVALPTAYLRARRGEPVAGIMLFGWAFYVVGALSIAALLRGWAEPTTTILVLFPLSTMVEMAAWMAVLSLRVQAIHRNADRARLESETLRTMAHTDALTGLPNRRGLQDRLALALTQCSPQQILAVYLLDLDGFKPINDGYGHDVGDALLIAVGRRLQQQLRGSDVVARLGGDEFVVLAGGLNDENTAHALGQKMLAAFEQPFDAAGQHCEVGLTVGYALAPLDGSTADELIKRADAAMYAGKQAGRLRVQRGRRKLALA
jgi:diguanylate cyclase